MKKLGLGITGSFCSFEKTLKLVEELCRLDYELHVFVTQEVKAFDTRFMSAKSFLSRIEALIHKPVIDSLVEAETYGPDIQLDAFLIYPCSGNTLAKLVYGINDNAVTMGVKATLRHLHPIVLGICTNDGLSSSGKNIMTLYNTKNFYLVPMYQDDIINKPNSLITCDKYILPTLKLALQDQQYQPLFLQL